MSSIVGFVLALLLLLFSADCRKKEVSFVTGKNSESVEKDSINLSEEAAKPAEKKKPRIYPEATWDNLHEDVKIVIKKILTVRGGLNAQFKLKNFSYKSVVELGGFSVNSETHWRAPETMRIEYSGFGALHVSKEGVFFELPEGVRNELSPEERERLEASLAANWLGILLPLKESGLLIEMSEDSEVFGKEVFKFRLRSEESKRTVFVYFDRADFTLMAIDYDVKYLGKATRVVETFTDFKVADGVLLPHAREVIFYDADNKQGRKMLKEKINSFDFRGAETAEKTGKPQKKPREEFYLKEVPENFYAFYPGNLFKRIIEGKGSNFATILMELKKSGISLIRMPAIIYNRKEGADTFFTFSPFSLLGVNLSGSPDEKTFYNEIEAETFIPLEMPAPSGTVSSGIEIRKAPHSFLACTQYTGGYKYTDDEALNGKFNAVLRWIDKSEFQVSGNPVIYILKVKFYDPEMDADKQVFEICYPVSERVKKEPK
ncbi:MAG: hypothetical protein FJ088_03450 [Deltaproteobacteria bacterium]|nr:hypothetical protein [Deltaproteobacteria bacterium]